MDLLLLNVNEKCSAKSEYIFNIQFITRKLGQTNVISSALERTPVNVSPK